MIAIRKYPNEVARAADDVKGDMLPENCSHLMRGSVAARFYSVLQGGVRIMRCFAGRLRLVRLRCHRKESPRGSGQWWVVRARYLSYPSLIHLYLQHSPPSRGRLDSFHEDNHRGSTRGYTCSSRKARPARV